MKEDNAPMDNLNENLDNTPTENEYSKWIDKDRL